VINPILDGLAADLDLARRQREARLKSVAPPDTLLSDLHTIPFAIGDPVRDSVSGIDGVILGFGVEQIPTEE
jgi:hypothetical protein